MIVALFKLHDVVSTHHCRPPLWFAAWSNPQEDQWSQLQQKDQLSGKIRKSWCQWIETFPGRLMTHLRLTSPLSPNMESLGFGSCCPLMILSTSCVFFCPGGRSSSMGLKAAEKNWHSFGFLSLYIDYELVHVHTFTHALRLQNVSTVSITRKLGSVQFKHASFSLVIHCN